MKRKLFPILIAVLVTISIAINTIACNKETPITADKYTVNYVVDEGGYITGNVTQIIEEGLDGAPVTAKAVEGYEFDKWSDGLETAERTDTNVTENKTYTAMFRKKVYTLKYNAAKGGYIDGKAEQSVEYGSSGSKVTAVADKGYEFKNWSDGVQTAERTDKKITANKTLTAYFTEYTREFTLDYKFGTVAESEEKPEEVALTYANYKAIKYPVPTREHFTFNGWYIGENVLTDDDGNVTANEEIIKAEENEIYAKWSANETFTYKILLVYVTRIDAVLPTRDKTSTIHVDYTMSDLERQYCICNTKYLKKYLDKMTDGLVNFQIDEYYTTETIVSKDFTQSTGNNELSNSLFPDRIPEVEDMLTSYDSALTFFSMNDFDYKLHDASGSALSKYAEVNFDSLIKKFYYNKLTLAEAIDAINSIESNEEIADVCFSAIIHELAHTIEARVNLYSLHLTHKEYYVPPYDNEMYIYKMYYLQEAEIDGKKVGIPYAFWKGDIAKVNYLDPYDSKGFVGGFIYCTRPYSTSIPIGSFNIHYDVLYGDTITVKAVPKNGYRFVGWSDGVTTPERTDLITGDFEVTAIFEKL